MKANERHQPITGPLLKDLFANEQANPKLKLPEPTVGSVQLDPPDLYQDPGQGYNSDFTSIQE